MRAGLARKTGFLTLGIIVGLLSTELLLRAWGYAYARWRLVRPPDEGDRRRVLCLGDSFTFGVGAPKGFGYPEQLQALLDARSVKARVINAGVPGINSSRLYKGLEESLRLHRPHLLILMTGWNDANLNESDYWRVLLPALSPWRRTKLAVAYGLRECRLYKVSRSAWLSWRRADPSAYGEGWQAYAGLSGAEAQEALRRLEVERASDPGRFDRWLALGVLRHQAKRFPEALEAYRLAAEAEPGNPEAHFRLGYMLHLTRDRAGAQRALRRALNLDPAHAVARLIIGDYEAEREGFRPEQWMEPLIFYNLSRVLEVCRRAGVPVLLQNYPSPGHYTNRKLERVFRKLSGRGGIAIVDHESGFRRLKNPWAYFSGDEPERFNSHPNRMGYRLMAENLLGPVTALLRGCALGKARR